MEQHAIALLEAAGIAAAAAAASVPEPNAAHATTNKNDDDSSERIKHQMDAWLGIVKNSDDNSNTINSTCSGGGLDDMMMNVDDSEMLTAEDVAPLPMECFQHFRSLLQAAWQPTTQQQQQQQHDTTTTEKSKINITIPPPPGTAQTTGSTSSSRTKDEHSSSATTASADTAFLQWLRHLNRNLLLERHDNAPDNKEVTLADTYNAVRATIWLRAFLELHVANDEIKSGNASIDHDDHGGDTTVEPAIMNARLLLGQEPRPHASTSATQHEETEQLQLQQQRRECGLIQALYYHMQQLPILQSHMHQYTKRLQQPNNSSGNNRYYRQQPTITASGLIVHNNDNKSTDTTPTTTAPSPFGKNTNSPPQHEEEVLNGTTSSSSSSSSAAFLSSSLSRSGRALGTTERLAQYQQAQAISNRLLREWDDHLQRLQEICIILYRCSTVAGRKFTRTRLARLWADYLANSSGSSGSSGGSLRQENTQAAAICVTLNVLERIVMGISTTSPLLPSYQHLLLQQLIPLHQPNTLVLWRDQTPVLQLYHEPLTKCIGILLQKDQKSNADSSTTTSNNDGTRRYRRFHLFAATLQALLQPEIFPLAGNSSKQVLLLHEVDTLLSLIVNANSNNKNKNKKLSGDKATTIDDNDDGKDGALDETIQELIHIRTTTNSNKNITSTSSSSSSSSSWWTDLLQVLARCMSCENSLISERALQFCKNASFLLLIRNDADRACDVLLPALVRRSGSSSNAAGGYYNDDVSWNPTVRKMTYLTLKRLRETIDANTFERACNRVFGSGGNHDRSTNPTVATTEQAALQSSSGATSGDSIATGVAYSSTTPMRVDTSLKAGMGTWRPPITKATAAGSSNNVIPPIDSISGDGDNGASSSGSSILAQRPRIPASNMMPPPTFRPPLSSMASNHRGRGKIITPGQGVAPWATPSSSAGERGGGQPPLTITGVAPWAMQRQPPLPIPFRPPDGHDRPQTGREQRTSTTTGTTQQPPLTITGVAPWAMQPPPAGHKRRAQEAHLGGITEEPKEKKEPDAADNDIMDASRIEPSGYERVLAYMNKLKPEDEDEGISSWSQMQMAETPTLLPNLKFHDLVFGHDLGAGAFGSVRYARLIDRSKTRSHWSEYAVKIISTEKIRTLGYEASVQREIAVLRILSHPGIARLISSFRFREGAYLVLEYASGGDLHALLRKHGSLDQDSTRFVIGECCAALASIHEAGLLYGDLKPENILITESGHLKLTDFGGCRPVTQRTKELIDSIAQNALKDLRDGDWKAKTVKKNAPESMTDDDKMEEVEDENENGEIEDAEDDTRVEGTTAYLPPEVVLGAYPTTAADSWALGCVMFQCLSGRPPLLEDDDAATRHRIVSFHVQDSSNEVNGLFSGKHAAGISPEARDLIENLLERDASCRPGMAQVAQHNFFLAADAISGATPMDVFSLHKQPAYPLDVGDVSPTPDADKWSRRQYSSIWAPQPAAYDMALQDVNSGADRRAAALGDSVSAPIAEGEEASGFFTATAVSSKKPALQKMGLGRIAERAPLPPTPENADND